ncbi:hypothetical protein HK102_013995, partial [Quaeritorhiza haematococci]
TPAAGDTGKTGVGGTAMGSDAVEPSVGGNGEVVGTVVDNGDDAGFVTADEFVLGSTLGSTLGASTSSDESLSTPSASRVAIAADVAYVGSEGIALTGGDPVPDPPPPGTAPVPQYIENVRGGMVLMVLSMVGTVAVPAMS